MRSVPPRGSGWVTATYHSRRVKSRDRTHPLPRGGTDLMSRYTCDCEHDPPATLLIEKNMKLLRPCRATSFFFAILLINLCPVISSARPLSEYQTYVQQAVSALDALAQSDEGETD